MINILKFHKISLRDRQKFIMEQGSKNITKWIGSIQSVTLHTIVFIISFILPFMKILTFERMLLGLTTIVSLEAIYLSIFIQMSLNMSHENIEILQEDIGEIQKDVDQIGEGIDEMLEEEEIIETIKVLQKRLELKKHKN